MTGKYKPLYEYLVKMRQKGRTYWHTYFNEVELIIGAPLPTSARTQRMFWSNLRQPGRASTAWFTAGWKASNVDMKAETLIFQVDL